jgi:hypothetical protein
VEQPTLSVGEALAELERVAPGAPLLALGQTVFWDEPMKAGIALASQNAGYQRKFIAGVHDTDYFAKFPTSQHRPGRFKALPHNDTTTKGLWSAAGEFSALFGSETVITKEALAHAGLRIALLERVKPGFLDKATEAWGWRGVASLDEKPPVTAEVCLRQVWPELEATFDWALNTSLDCLFGQYREDGETQEDILKTFLCDTQAEDGKKRLVDCYQELLPNMAKFCTGAEPVMETTRTTELLRFNCSTSHLPRFELVSCFVNQDTRAMAQDAYNTSVEGSGIFGLSRFGTGAIPFDLVIPGKGRGTIRLGTRGAVIETREPQFLTFKKPLTSLSELAHAVEAKFGPDCTLVGKAVALIGMLAREFVFVFHEGASSYVHRSRALHQRLAEAGCKLEVKPILRVQYSAWDALSCSTTWLQLPEPLQGPFGVEHIWAQSFARKWKNVVAEQEALLEKLGQLRRPIDLIRYLDEKVGGSWNKLADEYKELHTSLATLEAQLQCLREQRHTLYDTIRRLGAERVKIEKAKGDHFRWKIFEKEPAQEDVVERERLTHEIERVIHELAEARRNMRESWHKQDELVSSEEILHLHERRRALELEAEFRRLKLIRDAVTASRGLVHASHRPSAWWFPLVSPDGKWFKETVTTAQCYLEPLI